MESRNRTMMSVFYDDVLLFCTDSFPAIPEIGEIISVRKNDISSRFVVTKREFVYQSFSDKDDREIFVIVRVRKPEFID